MMAKSRRKGHVRRTKGGQVAQVRAHSLKTKGAKKREAESREKEENRTIANTIWKQIPISTKMACGARNPTIEKRALIFTVGRGSSHRIRVSLNALDYYDVALLRIKRGGKGIITEEKKENIDDVNLGEVIYHMVNK